MIAAVVLTAVLASAATVGAERLITGADIKDGSITWRDIKKGALRGDRLAKGARHRVFVSKRRRARQGPSIGTSHPVNEASLVVPAGSYSIAATLSVANNVAPTQLSCQFTDSRGILDDEDTNLQWWTATNATMAPISLVGVATYTAPTTIYVTCFAQQGMAATAGAYIVAEQVAYDASAS